MSKVLWLALINLTQAGDFAAEHMLVTLAVTDGPQLEETLKGIWEAHLMPANELQLVIKASQEEKERKKSGN